MKIVRMSCRSTSGKYEIDGLTEEELVMVDAMLAGQAWVTVNEEGRLQSSPTRQPLPEPEEDLKMQPYWTRLDPRPKDLRDAILDPEFLKHWESPHLSIQHLCGYDWSETNYKHQASSLRSYGFDCLRSRRGDDGRFWELWYLPSLWMAKGNLKEAIGKGEWQKQLRNSLDFLAHNASFGTLDVSVQRLAMTID